MSREFPENGIWLIGDTSIFMFSFFVIINTDFFNGVYSGAGSFSVSQFIKYVPAGVPFGTDTLNLLRISPRESFSYSG